MCDMSFSGGMPCPDLVYAHYVAPTTLMRGLAEAKPIRQTHPSVAYDVVVQLHCKPL